MLELPEHRLGLRVGLEIDPADTGPGSGWRSRAAGARPGEKREPMIFTPSNAAPEQQLPAHEERLDDVSPELGQLVHRVPELLGARARGPGRPPAPAR